MLDVSNPTQQADHLDGAIGIRIPGDGYIYTVDTVRGLLILREK